MSRTDKDMPHWVTAEWYEPTHKCGWLRRPKYRKVERKSELFGFRYIDYERAGHIWEYLGDCDLPEIPVRDGGRYWWHHSPTRCIWEASWPAERYYQTRGRRCKKEWRRFEFNGPQRAAERDAARKVVQGDWEAEFPDGRTRHSVLWDMW